MVPVRVRLAGFLSYREPQELAFDGARLWLLAGPNGSGKSGLFDAITWALFGRHRGGTRSSAELIHKDRARCDVEFDFRIGGAEYRIDRSLRRTRNGSAGTQAIYQRRGHEWHPVPGTTRKTEFDEWIATQSGLDYEVFCASALLRQGWTDRFLEDTSKVRAEVIATVIGLPQFERLHQRALLEMHKSRAVLEATQLQKDGVGENDIEAARRQLSQQETAVHEAQESIRELEAALQASHRWTVLAERRRSLGDQIAKAEALQANAAGIERDFVRYRELDQVLPVADRVLAARGVLSQSEQRTLRLQKQQEAARLTKEILDREVTAKRSDRQALKNRLTDDESRLTALGPRRGALSAALKTQHLIEEQIAESQRLQAELKRFPDDLPQQLLLTRTECERSERLDRQLPLLERLLAEQRDLVATRQRIGPVAETVAQIRRDGESARITHDETARQLRDTLAELSRVNAACGESELAAHVAAASMQEMESLRGEPTCRHCGQPLTAAHFQAEADRRSAAAADAERRRSEAVAAREQFQARADELRQADVESERRLTQLRQEYQEQLRSKLSLEEATDRLETAIAELQSAVDVEFRNRPLADLKAEAAGKAVLRKRLEQVTADYDARQLLQQQLRSSNSTLEHLRRSETAGDADGIRAEQQRLANEEDGLTLAVKAGKQLLDECDRELDALARRQHEALAEATDLTRRLRSEEATREQCRETVEREMRVLPPDWQMRVESATAGDCTAWQNAREEFTARKIDDQHRQLEIARAGFQTLMAEARELDDALSAIPAAQRASVDEMEVRLSAARMQWRIAETALADCRWRVRHVSELQDRNVICDARNAESQREFNRWKRLAELLGPDGLQRRLMRDTERIIVENGNRALKRLSDTQFTLGRADAENSDFFLELQAIPTASGKPIDVAFLSGGQRFRIAVALALGLGELHGGRTQCLMIDEAFSNLDAAGQAALMRELHTLPNERILVTSHNDESAAAFENAWRFELVDGATRVRRAVP